VLAQKHHSRVAFDHKIPGIGYKLKSVTNENENV